jgi:hypothetical protein
MRDEGHPHLVKKYGTLEGNMGFPLRTRVTVDREKIHRIRGVFFFLINNRR